MLAEKQIVAQWLRQSGFFCVRPLYAKLARDLGFLAIKYGNGLIDTVWHVESICWVSVTPEPKVLLKEVMRNRFANTSVLSVIKEELRNIGIEQVKVDQVLIVGEFTQKQNAQELAEKLGIKLFSFANIFSQTLTGLDTHYDRDPSIRSLQLFKFILANEADALIEVLFGNQGIVSASQRRQFARKLLDSHTLDHEFSQTDIEHLRPLLAQKKVTDIEALAKLIEETLLNKKTRQVFIDALANRSGTKPLVDKNSSLGSFFD